MFEKTALPRILLTHLFAALPIGALAQERIVNGEMSAFASGVPDGWTQSDTNASRITSSMSATNSPFVNRYPDNSSSWSLDDDATSNTDGYIQNGYAPSARVDINFDFHLQSLVAGGTWGVQYNNSGQPTPNVSLIQFRIDTNFYTAPFDGSVPANTPQPPIIALAANTWYNVNGFIDVPAGTYGGTISAFGGASTPFSGTINTTGLNSLAISGTQVRDRTPPDNGTLLLDNISVIPEPATASLLGLAGLAVLGRRRR